MKNRFLKSIKKIFQPLKKDNFKEAIEDLIEEQEVSDEKLDAGTKKNL